MPEEIVPTVILRAVASSRAGSNVPTAGVRMHCSCHGLVAGAILLSWLTKSDVRLVMPQVIAGD